MNLTNNKSKKYSFSFHIKNSIERNAMQRRNFILSCEKPNLRHIIKEEEK